MNRRNFVTAALASAASTAIPAWAASNGIKAVGFDGLALFDPRPIFAMVEQFLPGRGAAFAATWRARQFDYTWLRTMMGSYVDFVQISADALQFTEEAEKASLAPEQRQQLLAGFLNLKVWPDVVPALKQLKAHGIGLAPLTDFSLPMLEAGVRNNPELRGVFDHLLSTDLVKAYKPDPRSYQMGIDAFGLPREQIAFVAFAGWDAAGAKTFGFPTLWANRLKAPTEQLGVMPNQIGADFKPLPAFVGL